MNSLFTAHLSVFRQETRVQKLVTEGKRAMDEYKKFLDRMKV